MTTTRPRHASIEESARSLLVPALLLVIATTGLDVVLGPELVLTPLLIAGPLVAAAAGPPRHSVYAGLAGVVGAFGLGFANDIEFTRRHYVSMATVVVGTLMGFELSRRRERREQQLVRAMPKVDQATRLVRAMHSGQMGEWSVDLEKGRIHYDEEVAGAFGRTTVDPAGFVASKWSDVVDERDRATVVRVVEQALERRTSFRFDHRCVWPDGSLHWLEVVGQPFFGPDGALSGAQGLVWNVDDRHRKLDERARLLDLERYARLRAEYISRVHDVLGRSVDVEEILVHVTRACVPDLADRCNAVFVCDRPADAPLIVSSDRDAIGELDEALTVPIQGQLGMLGSLHLMRGPERDPFIAADVELAEELASRCGSALNTAVLFARQQTSSEALETLQRVSGWLSRAVTRVDVASATVTHGAAGLRADAGSVFVHDQASTLLSTAAVGLEGAASDEWMRGFGERAIEEDRLIVATTDERPPRTVLAAPLKILDHTAGAMVFQFASRREFAPAELAMAITLASRCAGALERASFYERERQSVLMLQRRLLPQVPSIPAWLEVGYRYEPAAGGQVGGDWFQLINVDEERVVAVVGDAVGHGLGAAAAMGQLKSSIATAVSIDPDPAEVLRIVDRFADVGTETMAATAVAALLDRRGVARLAAAGHPPPVFVDAAGVADVLDGGRRPLLGYGNGRPGDAAQRLLVGGDLMLLYSDGLVERRHEVLDVGVERLRDLLVEMRDQPPQSICDQLVERLATDGHDDDVALLLVRYVGEALPPG